MFLLESLSECRSEAGADDVFDQYSFKSEGNILLEKHVRGAEVGKKKVISEGAINELVYPAVGDVLGVAIKLLGYDRVLVKCQDGRERLCRIRGKMKRRVWIREGDIVLVSPWEFQTDKRGDLVWRYTRSQAESLRRKGLLTM